MKEHYLKPKNLEGFRDSVAQRLIGCELDNYGFIFSLYSMDGHSVRSPASSVPNPGFLVSRLYHGIPMLHIYPMPGEPSHLTLAKIGNINPKTGRLNITSRPENIADILNLGKYAGRRNDRIRPFDELPFRLLSYIDDEYKIIDSRNIRGSSSMDGVEIYFADNLDPDLQDYMESSY